MPKRTWLILSVTALVLGLVLLYFALAPVNPLAEPPTPENCTELKRGEMSAKVSSYLGTYEGDIIIQVWGVVTVSDNSPPMTPKGRLDSMTDDTYPVSKHRAYSAVLYKGDDVLFVGDSNDFYVAPITNLFLGLNESHHADDIAFRDNKGFWNWKVCARDGKAKLYPFKESRVP